MASGFNFAIPVSVVKEYMDSPELHPGLSKASIAFNEGLNFFYQQFYRKALDKFEKVKKLNKNYPQVAFYIDQCRTKITHGNGKNSPPREYILWIMILIAFLTGGYLLWRRRRSVY